MITPATERLMMRIASKPVRQSTIPMPKTSRFRAMRVLKGLGYATSTNGMWYLTDAGYSYLCAVLLPPAVAAQADVDLSTLDIDTLAPAKTFKLPQPPLIIRLLN